MGNGDFTSASIIIDVKSILSFKITDSDFSIPQTWEEFTKFNLEL